MYTEYRTRTHIGKNQCVSDVVSVRVCTKQTYTHKHAHTHYVSDMCVVVLLCRLLSVASASDKFEPTCTAGIENPIGEPLFSATASLAIRKLTQPRRNTRISVQIFSFAFVFHSNSNRCVHDVNARSHTNMLYLIRFRAFHVRSKSHTCARILHGIQSNSCRICRQGNSYGGGADADADAARKHIPRTADSERAHSVHRDSEEAPSPRCCLNFKSLARVRRVDGAHILSAQTLYTRGQIIYAPVANVFER